jgi:hypothetical protein
MNFRWLFPFRGRKPAAEPRGGDEGFRPGQRVRCIADGAWCSWPSLREVGGPAFGEVVTISACQDFWLNGEPVPALAFAPWPRFFAAERFVPIEDGELERLRAAIADLPKALVRETTS